MTPFGRGRRGTAPRPGDTPADFLIVGLGNPGERYAGTRHNVGADVLVVLAARHDARMRSGREHALSDVVQLDGSRVALAVPVTYMNDSGRAVAPLVRRHGITELRRLIVVHDELDLEPGRMKLKVGGGLAGHNGLRSIRDHLGDAGFARLRIGVGKPASAAAGKDHVLRKPSAREREVLEVAVQEAADAVEAIVADGLDAVMQRVNAR